MTPTELHRYWIRFDISPGDVESYGSYVGLDLGCGVTAYDLKDALAILQEEVFGEDPLPPVIETIEDVDIRQLDQGRVIPNMMPPNERGIWFPMGYWKP